MSDQRFEYYAFISYSHKDEKWAQWLHHRLEAYKLPNTVRRELGDNVPKPPYKVFRDVTDLGVGDLKENLGQELVDSRYLIVICSPNSAQPNAEGKHWVNDEIKKFIDLGRKDQIVPFIVGGKAYAPDAAQECLPPAIKENNILGTDVSIAGREYAFIHVVAKILGLKFDHLYQRHLRAEQKKKWMRVTAALGLLCLLGIGADYERIKTAYFTDYVEKNYVPQGLLPLKKEEVERRNQSWKFTFQHWKVISAACVNSAGTLMDPGSSGPRNNAPQIKLVPRASMTRIYYRADGAVERLEETDLNGKTVRSKFISSDQKFESFKDPAGHGVLLGGTAQVGANPGSSSQENKSIVAGWEVAFLPDGKINEIHYKSSYNQPACDANGVFGQRYTYTPLGQVQSIVNLDGAAKPSLDAYGSSGVSFAYDAPGNLVDSNWVFASNTGKLNSFGFVREKDAFDPNGNVLVKAFYDAFGQPVTNIDGIAKSTFKYDAKGNRTESVEYAADPASAGGNSSEILKWSAQYDNRGYETQFTLWESGVEQYLRQDAYDSRGNLAGEAYFGQDGKPIWHNNSYSRWVDQFDAHDVVIQESYFGTDGKPCYGKDGYATIKYLNDENGNETGESYYDTEGKPILGFQGYAKCDIKRDERGNSVEWKYYGIDGNLKLNASGYARLTRRFDESGHELDREFWGVNGEPVLGSDGYAKYTCLYDDNGRLVDWLSLGVKGEMVVSKLYSYAHITKKYDSQGNEIEEDYFGADGKPSVNKQFGYAKWTAQYDKWGHQTELTYWGAKGKLVMGPDGYAKTDSVFDDNGKQIEWEIDGPDGKLLLDKKKGYAKWTQKFDAHGQLLETAYYGLKNQLVMGPDGSARWTETFDDQGNVTETAYYGVKNTLIPGPDGYAKIIARWDSNQNEIAADLIGPDGKPILGRKHYASWVAQYDKNHNIVDWECFGVKGEPVDDTDGLQKWTATYDDHGAALTVQKYDAGGNQIQAY